MKSSPRILELQKRLEFDAVIVENPVDLYYLTSLHLSRGIFVATKEDSVLFVDGRYFAKAQKEAPCPIRLLAGNCLFDWLDAKTLNTLEFDSEWTSFSRYDALKTEIRSLVLKPKPGILKTQRAVKDFDELANLKKAADVTMSGLKHIESLLKEGISEEEVALEFEFFVRKAGASMLSFSPIIAFGENSAYPHYRAGKATLQKGQIVLMDVGAVVDGYAGDLTRVVFFGEGDLQLQEMLSLTKEAHKQALAAVAPGATFGDLDRVARAVFAEARVEDQFIHGLGHGIGLETHEYPSIKAAGPDRDAKLEIGMVFTIEPGLYRPGLGGVRWEDVVVVTKNGCELLTC